MEWILILRIKMKINKVSSAKVLFGCFNTVFFACGFAEVICGFLLLCDSRRQQLSRLLAAPDGPLGEAPAQYAALALLAAGLAVCAAAALGCWAAYMPSYVILTFYFLYVLALLVCTCAGGVVAAAWPRCAGLESARGGPVGALQGYYALPDYERFTAAVDLAQTELECCGMTDARNYDMSVWQLRRLGPRGVAVPLSCCTQTSPASHLNPTPRNLTRCQDLQADPQFRHIPGCLGKLEDWYHEQFIVIMISLFVVALLKLGVLLVTIYSCVRLRKQRQEMHTFMIKSIDNKKNQNIYETKMGSMHEEPIMAKYVQPNNFYSPRVRNPRIFSKPNEMV